jgi:23S rRNA (guanosine2251-2'-O)-methyltransferase
MDESLACGLHAVLTALRKNPERIAGIWVSAQRADRRVEQILEAARAGNVKFHRVPRAKLDQMAEGLRHQGVVARLRATPARGERDLPGFIAALPRNPLLLVLDGVQDPHNLGACLRVADAAGVDGVVVPRDRAPPLSAAARRAASGAAETIPLFQVTNLTRVLDGLKGAGLWLYGAAQDAPDALYAVDFAEPSAIVLGGEESGLRRLTRERCDRLVHIPMAGTVDSLNVSVAAGVILYEAVRQRGQRPH